MRNEVFQMKLRVHFGIDAIELDIWSVKSNNGYKIKKKIKELEMLKTAINFKRYNLRGDRNARYHDRIVSE